MASFFCYRLAEGEWFSLPKTICTPNFSSLGLAVLEERANKETNKQTHTQTDGHPIALEGLIENCKIPCKKPDL